jgi:F-type H+-transporting ATPase subunit b
LKPPQHHRCKPVLSLLLLLATALCQPLRAGAQDGSGQPPAAHAAQPSSNPASSDSFLTPRTVRSQNLVAAEEEDDTAAYRHSASVRVIGRWLHLQDEAAARLFEFLNFAILAGGVLFGLWKFLPKTLRARRDALEKELVEAREAIREANARMKAIEEKFSHLDQEISAIRAQAEKDGIAEEARIRASIESERQRILAAAEQEVRAASLAGQRELKVFAAELAVARARKMIFLTEDRDRLLLRQFAQELGTGMSNGGRN